MALNCLILFIVLHVQRALDELTHPKRLVSTIAPPEGLGGFREGAQVLQGCSGV